MNVCDNMHLSECRYLLNLAQRGYEPWLLYQNTQSKVYYASCFRRWSPLLWLHPWYFVFSYCDDLSFLLLKPFPQSIFVLHSFVRLVKRLVCIRCGQCVLWFFRLASLLSVCAIVCVRMCVYLFITM